MFTIRLAGTEDKPTIQKLYVAMAGRDFNDEDLDYVLATTGMVVAEAGDAIVGFGGIDIHARVQLRWLYVLTDYQRCGVGSEILKRLEKIGWNTHLTSLRVHSTPEAVNFYRKHAYQFDEVGIQQDHEGIGLVKSRPHVFLISVVPRSIDFSRVRDGFLVLAGAFYLFGYLVWAINAYKNHLGLVPALEFQYFVAGIIPAVILSIVVLLVIGYLRIKSSVQSWLGPRVTGKRRTLRRIMVYLWPLSLVFLFVTFSDWFERLTAGFFMRTGLGVIPVLLFTIFTLLLPPRDARESKVTSEKHGLIGWRELSASWFNMFRSWGDILARVYAGIFVLAFPVFAFFFFVERVYPKIPQEFGGALPRPACLDLVKTELSTTTLVDLAQPGAAANDTILRSTQVELLFSGSGVLVLRKNGRVYEITRSAVQSITNCN